MKHDQFSFEEMGYTLRFIRKGLGYTQADMARRLDVDRAQISRWERGQTRIPRYQIERYAELIVAVYDHMEELEALVHWASCKASIE